jgi:chromosome segregation protein
MLKALELHGFKSFADRARFEFPEGITVVVGPNGSGKSNIVDGIKWVLGEQSAKSLRGKEMSDVIFKGSGNSGRKPMNSAEATLVFDNADRRLPLDAPEVHITRRVFRSGEGEYLINRQPARLKDIRDLFRGTGVGVDAYSLIEQGKVDRLLQASPKDRRAMFEEAAGISRFKAKKVEAQRRLERVEQNLLRLSDIVEEVENRLKTVRAQAGKARRYREYSERLQQLRTQIARVDWDRLSEELAGFETKLAAALEEIQTADAEAQRLEAQLLEHETAMTTVAEELRNLENQISQARERRTQQQATIDHERERAEELANSAAHHRQNLLAMSDKAGDARARLQATEREVAAAEEALAAKVQELAQCEQQSQAISARYQESRRAADERRGEYVAKLQAAAALASQVEAAESQLATVQQSVLGMQGQLAELATSEEEIAEKLASARDREQTTSDQLTLERQSLEQAQHELAESRNLHASRADDLAQLQARRRAVAERHEVLAEFERTLEGIGAGVKQVLARAGLLGRVAAGTAMPAVATESIPGDAADDENIALKEQPDASQASQSASGAAHPWSLVQGVVADFVQVAIEYAAAIDAALGDTAQMVVVAGGLPEVQSLIAAANDLAGRVVALPNPPIAAPEVAAHSADSASASADGEGDAPDTTGAESVHPAEAPTDPAILGRAAARIECEAQLRPLFETLLGETLIVRTLADALRLRESGMASRLVTLGGELVDEHGGVHFGPRQSAISLVSRRSQLRAARLDLAVLDQQSADAHRETQHLKREIERHENAARERALAVKTREQEHTAAQAAVQTEEQRAQQLRQQKLAAQAALTAAGSQSETIEAALRQVTQRLAVAQQAAETIQSDLTQGESLLAELDTERQAAAEQVTVAKVALARCQQRHESLLLRLSQFQDDQRERERALAQVRQQEEQAISRQLAAELAILAASADVASVALSQQTLAGRHAAAVRDKDAAQRERGQAADALAALRRRALSLRDQEHQLEMSAEQVRHQRQTLADRLREDYGIELTEILEAGTEAEAAERAAALEEIESLRRKINQIGAVNLDALDELDDLESRFGTLSGQHKDLTEAKQALERIIHKINADSRRLFLETLEAIRVNFQALYRKAFGGGKADIVLEEGVDVLECGVDIIATPPGKPSFNNSLLSGGERALTAVALLLAIFQFRPSPFCVLDEVDAPFDEANIGRFIDVLKDFLGWTRFVIVTHSKKTMTAATTLYGVTMQESGVSKRVSVRFDDVTDDGHIRSEALARSEAQRSEAASDGSEARGVA